MNEETWNLAVSKLGISSTAENFEELVMMEICKVQVHCFDLTRLYNSCQNLDLLEEYVDEVLIKCFDLIPGENKLSKTGKVFGSLLFGKGYIIKMQEYSDNWGHTFILPLRIYYTSENLEEIQSLVDRCKELLKSNCGSSKWTAVFGGGGECIK